MIKINKQIKMQKKTCDFLIVGGGVIGLTCARALAN
jgi:glycine/D-amino acid oxidase-like deaminating enzyme